FFDRVSLLAGTVLKTEVDSFDGFVIFSLKGVSEEQILTIKITSCDAHGYDYVGGSPIAVRKKFIPPDAVEIIVLPAVISKQSDLPGFVSKLVATSKNCPGLKKISLDLAQLGKNDLESCAAWVEGKEFRTEPFSLRSFGQERAAIWPQTLAQSLWFPGHRRPGLACWNLLGTDENLDSGAIEIQPADWRKGQAGNSFNHGLYDECRLRVPLDGQQLEVIIIREFAKPQTPVSNQSKFLDGLQFGSSIVF